jgi:hypothetical protein
VIGAAILCAFAIAFTVAVGWVVADAYEREWRWGGWSVVGWAALCFGVWFVGFPLNLIRRRRAALRSG